MKIEDFPPQEPLSAAGEAYHRECLRLGEGITGQDESFGVDPAQSVAVHAAERPDGRVLLFWHGGGWTNGYKEWMAFMAPAFTQAGVTFVAASYRLAPAHSFPAGLEDCMDAVAWVHAKIARFGGDPNMLFVGGHSAGGHYASLLSLRRDWQGSRGLPADIVRGCLPISGVYLFGEGSGLSVRPRFLGAEGNEAAASPLKVLDGVPRPMLLAHGERDFPHLIRQAELFEQALREAGGEVERLVLPDRDHFSASYAAGEPDGPWVPHALSWMKSKTAG